MKKLKVMALDLEGVLLKDTFSPVIRHLVQGAGFEYTAEVERNLFAHPREQTRAYLLQTFNFPYSPQEISNRFFEARAEFLKKHGGGPMDGLASFLNRMKGMGFELVSYGAVDSGFFRFEMQPWLSYFSHDRDYFCINEVRPGIQELSGWVGHPLDEILFIDDLSWFGEHAKALGAPFIGLSSGRSPGFQRQEMTRLGVKHMASSLDEITEDMVMKADEDALAGCAW